MAKPLFNIYGFDGGNFGGNVYSVQDVAPALNTARGGNTQPFIVMMQDEKDIILIQYPHGFNDGFTYREFAPTITTSSWQHNNFIIETTYGKFTKSKTARRTQGQEVPY